MGGAGGAPTLLVIASGMAAPGRGATDFELPRVADGRPDLQGSGTSAR